MSGKKAIAGLIISLALAVNRTGLAAENAEANAPYQSDEHTMLLLHFDEGKGAPADSSQKTNQCSFRGEVAWSKEGKFGSCVSFDGLSCGYVRVERNDALNFGKNDGTVECWVKIGQTGGGQFLIFKGGYAANRAGYSFEIHYQTGQLWWEISDGAVKKTVISKTSLTDNIWHHIAGVIDRTGVLGTPNQQYLFVDGVKEGAVDITGLGSIDAPFLLFIGSDGSPAVTYGMIDELRISNCVRK